MMLLIADSFVLSRLPPSCVMVPAPPCALNPLVCVLALALVALLALQARSMQVASVEGQPSLSCDTPTSLEACNLTTLVLPLCHVMPLIADSFVLSQLPPPCVMVPAPPCALNPLVCVLALALVFPVSVTGTIHASR